MYFLFFIIFLASSSKLPFFRPAKVFEHLRPNPSVETKIPPYELFWYEQVCDHLNFIDDCTFQQKILVSTQYYDYESSNPVFFYTGNEGSIEMFYNNTGRIFELAEKFHGLVVFIEHRYYGDSWPSKTTMKYLSSEQALMDYVKILQDYLPKLYPKGWETTPKKKIIALGGSYGGMLSAWIRIKYPHIIDGALAASAPDLHFQGIVNPDEYSEIITKSFVTYGCNESVVRLAFSTLMKEMTAGVPNYSMLNRIFRPCKDMKSISDLEKLENLLIQSMGGLAVVNYPDTADFLQPLPPYPVKVTCDRMKNVLSSSSSSYDEETLLKALFEVLNVFYNSTNPQECIDLDWGWSPNLGDESWNFQACSEMVMPAGSNGKTDFFPIQEWDYEQVKKDCEKAYPGIRVSPSFETRNYHGNLIKYSSNIIFSVGNLDPWDSGSVHQENVETESIKCLTFDKMAHHVDLRFKSNNDPTWVTQGRELEESIIESWIKNE